MTLSRTIKDLELNKFVESTAVAGQPGTAVVNPDGTNVGGTITALPAIPAGTNLIGKVSASAETSTIYNGTTAITPSFAKIDAASVGDNTLVAADATKKIRVLSLFLINGHTATQTVRFESAAGGTALTGQMILGANGGFILPHNPNGWFETAVNELLNLELAGATTVDGGLSYILV